MENQGNSGSTGAGSTGDTSSNSEAGGRFAKAKEFASDAADSLKDKYDSTAESMKEKYDSAAESVKGKYNAATEAVKNRYTAVREKVDEIDFNEVTEKVRGYVRTNPGKALLISVGVGFALGMLLRRSGDDD